MTGSLGEEAARIGRAARRAALRLAGGFTVALGGAFVAVQAGLEGLGVAFGSLPHAAAALAVVAIAAALLGLWRYREVQRHQRLERALIEARDRAAASDEAKTQFLANMSHELRTPLNAIIGFAEVMENQYFGPLNARQQGYVADIRRSGRHLLALVDEVLDMARLDVATRQLEPAPLDLQRVGHEVERLLSHLLRSKRLALTLDIADAAAVDADPKALRQILVNLISNAIKASPENGTIRVRAEAGADGWLAVAVDDWGPGIDPHELARLRAPFARDPGRYQAESASAGSGLGLAIADRLVRLHGGELRLDSRPGAGTTARVTLPVAPAGQAALRAAG